MNNNIRQAFSIWSMASLGGVPPEGIDGFNGPGSMMKYTEPLRTNLVSFLEKYSINSMLDAPCGDFSWMSTIKFPDKFDYVGGDLHPDMIEWLNSKYSRQFLCLDITEDKLPSKDLMFVRDVLFHFNNEFKLKFFVNFLKNDFKYLLTSHHPKHIQNIDHGQVGNYFQPINWCISPWNFVEPMDIIMDYDETDPWFLEYPYRVMALWSKDQIKEMIKNIFYDNLIFKDN